MAAKKTTSSTTPPPSFEEAVEELEELTERLAHEPESLNKLIDDFERGQSLIHFCHASLKTARERITVIQASLQSDSEDATTTQSPSADNDDVRLF
ncbi:exodeoxyribonuclease VII small subunit [Akkermansiaceae bacterium]|nr:exodeoxyribonuclease VII small subunit [Akkermansiaceae bacterium]MDB4306435.1 exodeoxyribonuclease VII small subunit [bacterium]MDA7518862.1 exodeoxyribonuclease VII small subunit [Akkermansiaceae bacterium]MDA7538450.1 exodeoxyribonuclease VII small subunit [Akkermansiaceae bacterium]MDA7648987.1 exodeoxyribonuclease VII small subunit [Akkermansiaceae bacterium]